MPPVLRIQGMSAVFPGFNLQPMPRSRRGISKAEEQGLVQQFVTHAAVNLKDGEAHLSQKTLCIGLPGVM